MTELTGRTITIYGQQQVVRDLIDACAERGVEVRFEVDDVAVHGLDSDRAVDHLQGRRAARSASTAT